MLRCGSLGGRLPRRRVGGEGVQRGLVVVLPLRQRRVPRRQRHRLISLLDLVVMIAKIRGALGCAHLFRHRLQRVEARPGMDARAAVSRFDEPDRLLREVVDLAPKIKAGGGEAGPLCAACEPVHVADHPLSGQRGVRRRGRDVGFRLGRDPFRHAKEPDLRLVHLLELSRRHERADAEFHVRLPGAKPDIADQHVVKRNRVFARDSHIYRRGGRGELRQFHRPRAVLVCDRRRLVAAGCHGHALAGSCRAPDRHARVALQHHVVAENRRQFYVGVGEDGGQ